MENNKYMSFPRDVVGNLPLSKLLMKEKKQPYLIKQAEDPRQKPSGMTSLFDNGNNGAGFTLIELLVVVLIIGILAAVALPQYQKAVEKSKATQALTILKSVYQAQQSYLLANGEYATSFDELALDIPWTGTANFIVAGGTYAQGKSNGDWSIQLRRNNNAIVIGRISGQYQGAGFIIYGQKGDYSLPADEIVCIEWNGEYINYPFSKTAGDYCSKLFKGTQAERRADLYYFTLP